MENYIEMVMDVKHYIEENYTRDIDLNEISKRYYITSSYLSKIFKTIEGMTFRKYLYTYRIKKAKDILSSDFENIVKVSRMVGFKDVAYFYRVFSKVEGITPAEYIFSTKVEEWHS